ncbi:ras association domain-containing protein 1 isoform X1 [Cuculus canorus]|uniref:ras association domain-containing protein 1 isoform X1 n=1 Tax=Cuculus canorus TaxID=55661 RepID=UPI0023AB3F7A|nr:ras association domain-containing protein 1 isoform X1 [Cuculus canorus]
MLCCARLGCTLPSCARPCRAMPSYAMLYCAGLCCARQRQPMPCRSVPGHAAHSAPLRPVPVGAVSRQRRPPRHSRAGRGEAAGGAALRARREAPGRAEPSRDRDRGGTGLNRAGTRTELSRGGTEQNRAGTELNRAGTELNRDSAGPSRAGTVQNRAITELNRAGTGLTRASTGPSRAGTGLNRASTGLTRAGTELNRAGTGPNRASTGRTRAGTGLNRTNTELNRAGTGPNRAGTGPSRGNSGPSRAGTGQPAAGAGQSRRGAEARGRGCRGGRVPGAALSLRGGAGGTAGSTASSGYCSQEDSDSEPELFYTARTSLGRRPRRRQDEPSEWEKTELDQEQVEQRIKEYNSQINSNLFMSMNKDGSYTGFIKVQLKLVRPVSVPATKRAPSLRPGPRAQGVKRRTSFYLPKGTVKHLHILSHTRVSEVIDALLRKFTVVDNPRKFALFERSEKDEQVYLRKLGDDEQPLRLRLLAGPSEKVLSFVLKENETGEVNWDAFTLPELHNFLRILQREEEEHVRQLRHRYARCRQKMQEALATLTPG